MELLEMKEKLATAITDEISLLALYRDEFSNMKRQVLEKDWIALQRSLETMNNISQKINFKDAERDSLYEEMSIKGSRREKESFHNFVSRLYGNSGKELQDLYRIIKHETRAVKVLSEGFGKYLNNRKTLINDVMEELVPHRKGAIYNRRGVTSHDMGNSSLVLNKHL